MHNKVMPWEVDGNPWKTESKFITWIRGVLRKGWSKHPLKLEYIKRFRKRIANPKPSTRFPDVWGMTCECCMKDTVQNEIEIDHRGEQGKFTTISEIEGYARHLFMITYEDIRAVCKPCHKIASQSQRSGVSFEEASLEKDVIAIMKNGVQDILTFCIDYGYNESELKNVKSRKEIVYKILRSVDG